MRPEASRRSRFGLVPALALMLAGGLLAACQGSTPVPSGAAGPASSAGASGAATTAEATTTAPTAPTTTATTARVIPVLPGMPPVLDPGNVYSAAGANRFAPVVASARALVYVPSARTGGRGDVDIIDQATLTVVGRFRAGSLSQHVVPSWDLTTLYVNASAVDRLVPIDPATGTPGTPIPVKRPYNLYFTPDGTKAVVQYEAHDEIDYYDPHTWELLKAVPSGCQGNNHADWSPDGRYFLVTCEFSGEMLKVDTASGDVIGKLSLGRGAMPQDVRLVPDGSKFYVADMQNDGVWIVDGERFTVTGQIPTGVGAHGIYPSRDGRLLYVANRGRHMNQVGGRSREGQGSVSVVDPATDTVTATWAIPGGGSPDMGGVSADGTRLWLSGRYDDEVYVFDTATGSLITRIPTVPEPHGLLVWPQPGRYSLGHTGNMR